MTRVSRSDLGCLLHEDTAEIYIQVKTSNRAAAHIRDKDPARVHPVLNDQLPRAVDRWVKVAMRFPFFSRNKSEPGCNVSNVPSAVGTLPTSTNPRFNTPNAVVRPSVGGGLLLGFPLKKSDTSPAGVTLMIVVPVPWRLLTLLKLVKFQQRYQKSHRIFRNLLCLKNFRQFRVPEIGACLLRRF